VCSFGRAVVGAMRARLYSSPCFRSRTVGDAYLLLRCLPRWCCISAVPRGCAGPWAWGAGWRPYVCTAVVGVRGEAARRGPEFPAASCAAGASATEQYGAWGAEALTAGGQCAGTEPELNGPLRPPEHFIVEALACGDMGAAARGGRYVVPLSALYASPGLTQRVGGGLDQFSAERTGSARRRGIPSRGSRSEWLPGAACRSALGGGAVAS